MDLSQMREVANQQARMAIAKSTRKKTAHQILNSWGIVTISALTTAVMGYFAWRGSRLALLGACAGLSVAIYYVWRAARDAGRLITNGRRKK
jgi:hypothetical protein